MKKIKTLLQAAIFLTALTIPALLTAVLPDRQISQTERRPLAEFPSWTIKSFLDKSYMTALENALLDHFPARDAFRTVKAKLRPTSSANRMQTVITGLLRNLPDSEQLQQETHPACCASLRSHCTGILPGISLLLCRDPG